MRLKNYSLFLNIVCPDRCLEERKAYKKLVEEVKNKRDTETDKVHYILRNKIVSYSKNCKSESSGSEEKLIFIFHTP